MNELTCIDERTCGDQVKEWDVLKLVQRRSSLEMTPTRMKYFPLEENIPQIDV